MWILHLDLDEFLAAVEVLRHPELAGRPVVVGGRGDPRERGVVSTASYAAREYGIRSGMPLRVAARKCPEAVFLPVDRPVYEEASEEVMATLRTFDGPVEVLGWDEAFLGIETVAPESTALAVQSRVLARTSLHCSVGIGDNKLRAKIATDLGKPRGIFRLTRDNWVAVMGERPTSALWGIGSKTGARLEGIGIRTVRDLAVAEESVLRTELGPTIGPWCRRLARGAGSTEVDPGPYVARGHGREETFQEDLYDWGDVAAHVDRLARRVAADLERDGRPAIRVGIKLRYAPFRTTTRSLTLQAPTGEADRIAGAALELLGRLDRSRPVRLVGVRAEMAQPGDSRGRSE